jgi:hypothetical protein
MAGWYGMPLTQHIQALIALRHCDWTPEARARGIS